MSLVPELLPLFLKLEGRAVLVVGAGPVAERKVLDLVDAKAKVHVVAPHATDAVAALSQNGTVSWSKRVFAEADTDDAWLVLSATGDATVQRAITAAAEARRIFVVALDDPPNASAYSGAIVRKPPFLVAISSSGAAPALARLLREMLDAFLPDESWSLEAQKLRAKWRAENVPMAERFGALVRAFKERAGS